MFTYTSIILKDLDKIIERLYKPELLSPNTLKKLCASAIEILSGEKNIHSISFPITVCGDIHGQFYDLMELFHVGGKIPYTNYLFLGDYVNDGYWSIEVILLLLALKVRYKNKITLLRGNADSSYIQFSMNYFFYQDCLKKFNGNVDIFRVVCDVFNYLPLCALIDNTIFCCHGGLSPFLDTFKDIFELNRVQEIPYEGGMYDLVWSVPEDRLGWHFPPWGQRIYSFGPDITKEFLHKNGAKYINRSCELVMNGYEYTHNKQVITVFSAPNYKDRCENLGAIIEYDQYSNYTFLTFETVKPRNKPKAKRCFYPDYWCNSDATKLAANSGITILKNNVIICWRLNSQQRINEKRMCILKLIIFHWSDHKEIPNDLVLLIIKYCSGDKYFHYW